VEPHLALKMCLLVNNRGSWLASTKKLTIKTARSTTRNPTIFVAFIFMSRLQETLWTQHLCCQLYASANSTQTFGGLLHLFLQNNQPIERV